ncbi:MAG: DUF3592 domain-containing protein [Ginsengibacter sp.]
MSKIIYLIIFLSGLLFFFVGIKILYDLIIFTKQATKTIGTVTQIKTSTGRNNVITYSPVIEFEDKLSNKHSYDVAEYYSYIKFSIGEKVKILYNENDFHKVKIDSFFRIYLIPIVLFLLAIFGVIVGLKFFVK